MDLKQIETFVQVADLGSFTRAAAVLRVAQPALSRQVRALEVELRQPLFDRNGRGVTLTAAGQRLLAHGRGILQQLQRALQEMEEQRDAASGLLGVGLPPSVGRALTVPLVDAFRARFPRATLTVVEGLSNVIGEWLMQGRIDCAVVYGAAPAPALRLMPVRQEPLYLVSSRRPGTPARPRPVPLAELARHELVIPSRPHAIRMRVEAALAGAGLAPRVALQIESVPAILDLVRRHPLHAVLAADAVRGSDREAAYTARPIRSGRAPLATTLSIATSAQRPGGPLLDQAVALLQELLAAAPPAPQDVSASIS